MIITWWVVKVKVSVNELEGVPVEKPWLCWLCCYYQCWLPFHDFLSFPFKPIIKEPTVEALRVCSLPSPIFIPIKSLLRPWYHFILFHPDSSHWLLKAWTGLYPIAFCSQPTAKYRIEAHDVILHLVSINNAFSGSNPPISCLHLNRRVVPEA